jgi:drug/metabolite transporter (DMT)-like permease
LAGKRSRLPKRTTTMSLLSSSETAAAHETDLLLAAVEERGESYVSLTEILPGDNDDTDDDDDEGGLMTTLQDIGLTVYDAAGDIGHTVYDAAEAAAETIAESVVDAREAVVDATVDEVHEIAETVLGELHKGEDDDRYFLDMALMRGLSVLPGEMQQAGERAQANMEHRVELKLAAEQHCNVADISAQQVEAAIHIPLSAYLLLASAIISLSAIGPALQYQTGATSSMKIVWRQLATGLLLCPMAMRSVWKHGLPTLDWRQWGNFLVMATCYVTMTVGFALSLEYTAVGNAVILSNSQSILLLAGKFFVAEQVTHLEGTGALVAFLGAVLCSKDSQDVVPTSFGDTTILGDCIAMLAAFGGVGYLVFAKPLRSEIDLFVFMTANMLVGTLMIILFMVVVLKEEISLDMDPAIGLFGWLQPQLDRLPVEIIIVVICNLFGTLGYIRAMYVWGGDCCCCCRTLGGLLLMHPCELSSQHSTTTMSLCSRLSPQGIF